MTNILITGGTGLIGQHLSHLLTKKGYKVLVLSRTKNEDPTSFYWNIDDNYVDKQAIIKADYIIHLAGANIAEKRWTKDRKELLINSRVKTANLLFEAVKKWNPSLKGFISASGIGYYGAITSSKIFTEEDKPGNDFISEICVEWENAAKQFETIGCRTVILRTGVVFAKKESALQKIVIPIKFGFGSAIGTGKQFMPWIHIHDLCGMYLTAIENTKFSGVYNAVAPESVSNKALSKTIATILKKPFWLPNIPSFLFKLGFGEMAVILLNGSKVSSEKITETGFKFQFKKLENALINLIN
jgi:hypothetical protein